MKNGVRIRSIRTLLVIIRRPSGRVTKKPKGRGSSSHKKPPDHAISGPQTITKSPLAWKDLNKKKKKKKLNDKENFNFFEVS